MNVSELLDSLREHGTIDSQGQFTVSLSQARRKLTQYHSSNQARYLLMLVSAGIAAKATEMVFSGSRGGYQIEMPGAYMGEEALLAAFRTGGHGGEDIPGAVDMVLGLQLALAQGASDVRVKVGHPTKASYSWYLSHDAEQSQPLLDSGASGISVELAFPGSWRERISNYFRSLRGYVGQPEEARLLEQFCDRSLTPIILNKERINRPVFLPEAIAYATIGEFSEHLPSQHGIVIGDYPWRGHLALLPGRVQLVVHGVAYGQIEDCGLEGILYDDRLRLDISRENVVADAAYERLLEELDAVRAAMARSLLPRLKELSADDVIAHLGGFMDLALDCQLDEMESQKLSGWMSRQIGFGAPRHHSPEGFLKLYTRLRSYRRYGDLPPKVGLFLNRCAEAFRSRDDDLETTIDYTAKMVRIEQPRETLIPGYLQLGRGAFRSSRRDEKRAQEAWMEALDIVRGGADDKAEELIHFHMDFEVDHIMDQVAAALTMQARSRT